MMRLYHVHVSTKFEADERQQKLWVLGLQYTTNGVVKMPEALFGD